MNHVFRWRKVRFRAIYKNLQYALRVGGGSEYLPPPANVVQTPDVLGDGLERLGGAPAWTVKRGRIDKLELLSSDSDPAKPRK